MCAEERVAFLAAQTVAASAEIAGMIAENAYGE